MPGVRVGGAIGRAKRKMEAALKVAVVVPTVRENSIKEFLIAWAKELESATVIVVEDNPEPTFDIAGSNVEHYAHMNIERELGADAWIIPRKTDCVRSFGYFKAWQKKPDMVVTLDDDCRPMPSEQGFLPSHWARLNERARLEAWESTLDGVMPRGMPYEKTARDLPCLLNHGMWSGVPDFDAPTDLGQRRYPRESTFTDRTIPVGKYFPMCGMNLAFRPDAICVMYFLLMGSGYEFDRFGDIWAGIILKKIADFLGYAVHSGRPHIRHLRASNVWKNLQKEAAALEANETFWSRVDGVRLTGSTLRECYLEVARQLPSIGAYWERVSRAMEVWTDVLGR
jgi:hypothetical protein